MLRSTFLHQIQRRQMKGFTLVETLVSAFVISLVVLGPLTVAINSSTYARETKDVLTATYLGEEAIELLRHEQDSVYIRCTQALGATCVLNLDESPREAAWRILKARLKETPGNASCFANENVLGCSYDTLDVLGSEDGDFTKYVSNAEACSTMSLTTAFTYVCTGVHGSTGASPTNFSRSVSIVSVPTFVGTDESYNDDLRITVTVSFVKPNGYTRRIKVIDFLHAHA